tara:strand:+ start:581 stop:919 length:339 start_codon:yes stop_codon:yes gene_type:complete
MKDIDRHLDLSSKFTEMGQALILEGKEKKDYVITQSGNALIVLSALMYSEKDISLFSELCSMFSAKKIVENMVRDNDDYINYLKDKSNSETYDDYIKRINDLRKDNGHEPLS